MPFIFALVLLWANGTSAQAAVPPKTAPVPRAQITQLTLGLGATNTKTEGVSHRGVSANASLLFPSDSKENLLYGFSFRRTFDGEVVKRYDWAVHVDYFFLPNWKAGLIGGLQYCTPTERTGSYLKPLVGLGTSVILASWKRTTWSRSDLSIFADFRHAAGSTGSLVLNGESSRLKAGIISVGLQYSFAVLSPDH